MLVEERHDHLDELAESADRPHHLVVVAVASPWIAPDTTDAKERVQLVTHRGVSTAEGNRAAEARHPASEVTLARDETTEEIGQVTNLSLGSSAHDTALSLGPGDRTRACCKSTGLCHTGMGGPIRRHRAPCATRRIVGVSRRGAGKSRRTGSSPPGEIVDPRSSTSSSATSDRIDRRDR
ncbi:MAG TPA: hypothetical protein VFZ79_09615 [Acidimicrobiales bacterium]